MKMFFAAAGKKAGLPGLPKITAKKFLSDSAGQKMSSLPEHVSEGPESTSEKFKRLQAKMRKG